VSEYSTNAWVLHKKWSGDTSAQVTFLTRDKGVVRALCKGGRTQKKQALLQAFTPLWIMLNERSEWYYVQQIELLSPSLLLEEQYLFAGLYVNELLYHGLECLDAQPALYDAYETTLLALCEAEDKAQLEMILRRFERIVLLSMGYGVLLTHEVNTGLPVDPVLQYAYIAGEGVVQVNERGILGRHVLAFAGDNLIEPDVLKAAKHIMRLAIDHALNGKEIKARRLFYTGPVASLK